MDDLPKEWQDLVEHLRGTCNILTYSMATFGLDEGLEDNKRFCEYLDSELMLCNTCGWWAETHEIDDAGDCEECQHDNQDNDS